MIETVEATSEPDGTVRLHQPVRFSVARRAIVIIVEDGASTIRTALWSERALGAEHLFNSAAAYARAARALT